MIKYIKHILLLVAFVMVTLASTFSQTICNNKTGSHNGYTYEYWKSTGDGCMTLGEGGAFSVSWENVGNLLARMSKRPGLNNHVVQYKADFKPEGKSFLCVYGWTKNPLIEYYIVEDWHERNPVGGTPLGTIITDGGTYNLYRTERVNKPSIEGTKTFYQYWSVRTEKRTEGTITCANHFDAWKNKGLTMGSLYEVSLCLEALKDSKGECDITELLIYTGTGDDSTYVADTSITVIDAINSVEVPTSVVQNSTVNVSVEYSAGTDRDVIVMFQQSSSPWDLYVYEKKDVAAGEGKLNFSLAIPADVPVASNSYQFQTFITTDDGDWDTRLTNSNRKNISVTRGVGSSSLASISSKSESVKVCCHPNSSSVTIDILDKIGEANMYMFDMQGRIVYQTTLPSSHNDINISSVNSGIYLLQVTYGVEVLRKRIFRV